MPRKTLLEVVDSYLIKTNGFRVQSIFDTEEAESAAKIAEEVFYHIVEKAPDIQFTEALIRLDHANDIAAPNYLMLPASVSKLVDNELQYNCTDSSRGLTDQYRKMQYMDPREFIEYVLRYRNTDDNTEEVVDPSTNVRYYILNNKHPEYFTSFDGQYLAFDSYNNQEDTTLQSDKSLAMVSREPVFILEDNFYIPLPNHLVSMYIDGVVSECSETIRQEAMPMVRRRYQAQMAKLQKTNQRVGHAKTSRVTYGRKR